MRLDQLLLLHLMAGAGVAVAVYVTAPRRGWPCGFQVVTALFFWPLYLPLVLAPRARPDQGLAQPDRACIPPADELARAIAQADAELDGALRSLDGWAEAVLAREKDRLHELRQAWIVQAERIREMDRLLARADQAEKPVCLDGSGIAERLRGSQLAIRQNHERLQQVRQRTLDDLLGTLVWVRELVSMIHLAKFTGAPASRAEELVAQIAAAVEGLSALTWKEEAATSLIGAGQRALPAISGPLPSPSLERCNNSAVH
jgi:hypothetical protein